MLRGHKDRVHRWVNDCLARYYPFTRKDGKEGDTLQLGMRPIQLYEVAFPEPMLKEVLNDLQPYSQEHKGLLPWLRRLLKLNPLPPKEKYEGKRHNGPMFNDWIDVVGIGIKKDQYDKEGFEII